MAFIKKIWKDRIAEYPTRRRLTRENGDVELVTVARSEGTVSQEGDAFSAENLNELEERIGNGFEEVDSKLNSLFGDLVVKSGTVTCSKSTTVLSNIASSWLEAGVYYIKGVVSASPAANGLIMYQLHNNTANVPLTYTMGTSVIGGLGTQRMETSSIVHLTAASQQIILKASQGCDASLSVSGELSYIKLK